MEGWGGDLRKVEKERKTLRFDARRIRVETKKDAAEGGGKNRCCD